jgi:hypothetical protein
MRTYLNQSKWIRVLVAILSLPLLGLPTAAPVSAAAKKAPPPDGRLVVTAINGRTGNRIRHLVLHLEKRDLRGRIFRRIASVKTNATGVSNSRHGGGIFRIAASRTGIGSGKTTVIVGPGQTASVSLVLRTRRVFHLHQEHLLGIRPLHKISPRRNIAPPHKMGPERPLTPAQPSPGKTGHPL